LRSSWFNIIEGIRVSGIVVCLGTNKADIMRTNWLDFSFNGTFDGVGGFSVQNFSLEIVVRVRELVLVADGRLSLEFLM